MALFELTADAVRSAIAEFDTLGRETFLAKHGFGKAQDYFLVVNDREYDSKAIAGVAHGYLPGREALRSEDFTGGQASVREILRRLGFDVTSPKHDGEIGAVPGQVLSNAEIAQRFGVGVMGGMRRSLERNLLVLISDPFKGLYQDRWESDVLHYTGMGKLGDQTLTNQNRTLAESPETGVIVHLFEALEAQQYTYAGEVELAGQPYQEEQPDDEGATRKVWMFPLKLKASSVRPLMTEQQARAIEESQARLARKLPLDELKRRAQHGERQPGARSAQSIVFIRSAAVAEYVKRAAKGSCDLCLLPAPFANKQNDPYLECHHIVWLAKGGEDTIENTVALCPNCHKKMHVLNLAGDQRALKERALRRETPLELAIAPLGS